MRTWTNPLECKRMLRLMHMGQHYHRNNRMESFIQLHSCQNQCYQQSGTMMHTTERHLGSLNHYNTGDIGYKGQKDQSRLSLIIKTSYQASIILQHLANVICDGWRALRDLIVFTTIHWEPKTRWQTSLVEGEIITQKMRRNQNSTHSLKTKCSQLNNWKSQQWNLDWTRMR